MSGQRDQRAAAIVCTGNAHKVEELADLLPMLDLRPLDPTVELPPEDGATFEANALIKARGGAAAHPSAWVLADDSGLEVDALDGAPGVRSARFAGTHGDDAANTAHLLELLADVPPAGRSARFVCVLVAIAPTGDEVVARGSVEGRIADAPRGAHGFGYDPVFVPMTDELTEHDRTFAELGPAAKAACSHRARAARTLADLLVAIG